MSTERTGRIMVSFETGAMEWIAAWRKVFREEELDLWASSSLGRSEDWADRFDQSLDEARSVVVLLTEKYFHSEYLEHQHAWRGMERANDSGLAVVLVILERCPWEEFEQLRLIVSREGRSRVIDLSELDPAERRDSAWPRLGEELRREFLPDAGPLNHDSEPGRARHVAPDRNYNDEPEAASETEPDHREQWVPQSRIEDYVLAEEPRQVLRAAAELARRRGSDLLPLSTSCVLFALAASTERTAGFIASHLARRGNTRIDEIADRFFLFHINLAAQQHPRQSDLDRIRVGQSMTPNVEELLRAAVELARATTGENEIGARHLAAALLCAGEHPFGARKQLEEMGVPAKDLRQALLDFILKHHPEDDQQNWHAMLEGRPPQMRKGSRSPQQKDDPPHRPPTPSPERPQPTPPPGPLPGVVMAGFDADSWHRRGGDGTDPNPDLLDIKDEVNALASLAAAWTVEPPLSIGLFGDWGSGKTFFMRKMMDRVNELAQAARDSGKQQKDIAFYKNIVQIEFNAWHYVEGNLWASLVEHIFANLRLAGTGEAEDPDGINRLREKLFTELNLAREFNEAARARVAELESARNEAVKRHQAAKEEHDRQAKELAEVSAKDIWSEIQGIELTDEQKQRLTELGFSAHLTASTRDLHQTLEQLREVGGRARAQAAYFFTLLKRPAQFQLLAGALLGVVLLGVGVSWLMRELGLGEAGGTASLSAQAVALVTGALAWLRRQSERVSGALELLEPVRQAIGRQVAEAEAKRNEQLTRLEKSVELLSAECVEARREVEKAEQNVAELEARLAETAPSRQLARFIEDRAASEDYRRHLGILAVIRRDFEKLARLVARQREEERNGTEPLTDPTRINRIILYIDDLDRCPAHKVVEVLQAIHLLLAFPLFVVVVGVDSRWISRALEKTYVALLNPPMDGGKADESERLPGHGATPRDYLEKIFQIPFWIRPMQALDCQKLIGGLTGDSTAPVAGEAPPRNVDETNIGRTSPRDMGDSLRDKRAKEPPQPAAANEPPSPMPVPDAPKPKDRVEAIVTGTTSDQTKAEPKAKEPVQVELTPRTLRLEPQELAFMNELTAVLTRSPRSVKRFINCYRLIKAHLRPEQLAAFVGGDTGRGGYEPVMLLLAILNGAPVVADKILDRLTNRWPLFTFAELVGVLGLFASKTENTKWVEVKGNLSRQWKEQPEHSRRWRMHAHQWVATLNTLPKTAEDDSGYLDNFVIRFENRFSDYRLLDLADEINSDPDFSGRSDWARVRDFLRAHGKSRPDRDDLQRLLRAAPFVARFSFRVADVRQGERSNEEPDVADAAPGPA